MTSVISTITQLDLFVHSYFIALRHELLTPIMIGFTRLGDEAIAYPAVVLMTLVLGLWVSRRSAVLFFLTLLFSAGLNTWLKLSIGRLRPDIEPVLVVHEYSFPSGHAMNSIVFFGLASYLLLRKVQQRWQKVVFLAMMIGISFFMGMSRVYLGVHYLSDIIAGYGLGMVIVWLSITLLKRLTVSDTGSKS
jgi:undecaprenyl-diphosphatase